MPTIEELTAAHTKAEREIFHTGATWSGAIGALQALTKLVNAWEGETEGIWSIGESSSADLGSLLVGAYWAMAECHGGQASPEYALFSAIPYNPGCSCGPEPESCEQETYDALIALFHEAHP